MECHVTRTFGGPRLRNDEVRRITKKAELDEVRKAVFLKLQDYEKVLGYFLINLKLKTHFLG